MSSLGTKSGVTGLVSRILTDEEKSSLLIIYALLVGVVLLAGVVVAGVEEAVFLVDSLAAEVVEVGAVCREIRVRGEGTFLV